MKENQIDELGNRTFNIKVTMKDRWVNDFLSMLEYMQSCGNIGHTAYIGFCSDGDGDFRPKFEFDTEFEKQHGYWKHELDKENPKKSLPTIEVLYDAG